MPIAAIIATLPTKRPFAGMAWAVTVDFWRGLRLYPQDQTGAQVADYGSMLLADSASGPPAEALSYGVESANARAIFVQGTGVAALVTDGSGKPGPVLYLADASLDTVAKATSFGVSQLAQYAVPIRGTLERGAVTPPVGIHPGSSLIITDAQVGLAGTGRIITGVARKMLAGGLEDWVLSFGGTRPSLTTLVRKLAANPRA